MTDLIELNIRSPRGGIAHPEVSTIVYVPRIKS